MVHYLVNLFFCMPFYQFGEIMHLKCIPMEYWVTFVMTLVQNSDNA